MSKPTLKMHVDDSRPDLLALVREEIGKAQANCSRKEGEHIALAFLSAQVALASNPSLPTPRPASNNAAFSELDSSPNLG